MSGQNVVVDRSLLGSAIAHVPRADSGHVSGISRMDLTEHRSHFGRRHPSHSTSGAALIDELAAVGLTGRGGGHCGGQWRRG